ncbi:glycosyltransferase family 9 protein [Deltaproteobacteria bacterium TL4]
MPPTNILLIQLRRIGDVLMTTPSIRALKQAFPHATISFLTEPPSDQVLRLNPALDEIIIHPKSKSIWSYLHFLWNLRQKRFDLVIDFFGNPRSAQISWFTGAAFRIGYNFRGRRLFYSNRVDIATQLQYAAQHKALLVEELGVKPESYDIDFYINTDDRAYVDRLFRSLGITTNDKIVSISPVSRQPYKVWPPENFAKIADFLIERYQVKLLFIYGPGEDHFVDAVRLHMRHQTLPNYDVPTLRETRAIFEKVMMHIGNDNGPCHFAIAAKIPTIAIFGKPHAVNWTPPEQRLHRSVEFDPGCKNQCSYPQCSHLECINKVSTEQVQQVIIQLITYIETKESL